MSQITGMAISAMCRGLKELATDNQLENESVRRPAAGCEPLVETDKSQLSDFLGLAERSQPHLRYARTSQA